MGTCCETHLAAKIRDYARNAENGAVTVKPHENSSNSDRGICSVIVGYTAVDETAVLGGHPIYCANPADFFVSFYPKK